jgi:hypothetical protein
MASAAPPAGGGSTAGGGSALPAAFWLEAQLKHSRRQVQLLSDALVVKAEVTAELAATLTQMLRAQPPPSTQQAQLYRTALRRLRGVEFAEEVSGQVQADAPGPEKA